MFRSECLRISCLFGDRFIRPEFRCICIVYFLLVLTLLVCINCLSIFVLYNSDLYVHSELVMHQVTSPLCSTLLSSILLLVICSILLNRCDSLSLQLN
jgi:hypothetical protein